jgi:glycine cleavage system regulatory protein
VRNWTRTKPVVRAVIIGGDSVLHSDQKFYIKLIGTHHVGLLYELLGVLSSCGLDVLEAKAESDDMIDFDTFLVQARGGQKDFDDDKLEEIQHAIQEVLNDKESQVIFERCELEADFVHNGVLEIRVVGDHHPDILHEITDMLSEVGLDVFKAVTEAHEMHDHGHIHREEEEVFYARSPMDGGGQNQAILPSTRAKVREDIMNIIHTHDMHGEVMVKVIHEDEAAVHHHLPNFDVALNDMIATIRIDGPHHKEQLHETLDFLAVLKVRSLYHVKKVYRVYDC